MYLKLIKLLAPVLVFLIFSCSGEPPQVQEVWSQLNMSVDPETGEKTQILSLFIHGEDEDGEDDLDRFFLINDENQIVWEIDSEAWTEYREQGILWLGTNGIPAPGNGIFPEGNYRVLLLDLGGDRDEMPLYIRNNIPDEKELSIPEITFDSQVVTVRTDYIKYQFWFYGPEGDLVEKSRDLLPGRYQWNDVVRNIVRRTASFYVYTEPESGSWGLISGPYYFTD